MSLLDSIKIAFSSILAHKLRSILTMLGIIIGVGSIIIVVAIGRGGDATLKSKFAGSGNNTVEIFFREDPNDIQATGERPKLTEEDIFELKKIPNLSHVVKTNSSTETLDINDKKEMTSVKALDSEYFAVNKIKLLKGRSLTESDVNQGNNVVMISTEIKDKMYPKDNPVGKIIEVRGHPLEIIGVYKTATDLSRMTDAEILVPISLWSTLYGKEEIQNISIQANQVDQVEKVGKEAVDILNKRKSKDISGEYAIFDMEKFKDNLSQVTNIMTMIISGIAGISLLVGGIGVMNIMLVSVTERTREIGVRKALGATRGKILLQFLIEAVILTLMGGIIGIGIGYGGAYIAAKIADWPPIVSWDVVVGGLLFSMTLGIVFGLIPANKAAKLDPIEALRYE